MCNSCWNHFPWWSDKANAKILQGPGKKVPDANYWALGEYQPPASRDRWSRPPSPSSPSIISYISVSKYSTQLWKFPFTITTIIIKSDVSYCFGAYGNVLARMRALLQQMLYKHDSPCPWPQAAQHSSTTHSKLTTSKSDSQLPSLNKMDLKTTFPKLSGLILALETSHGFCYAIHVSCTSKSVEGKPARLA